MANDLGYTQIAPVAYKDPITVGWGQGMLDNITALASLLTNFKQDCDISFVSVDSLSIHTGAMMINNKLRKNTANITLGWANTGGNDIAETSSTGYYIWAFASGTTSTFEVAINQTSTNMTGNANARLIGWFWNNTANAIESLWFIDKDNKKHFYIPPINIAKDSGYCFYHNLGTLCFSWDAFLSQSVSGTGWYMHDEFSYAQAYQYGVVDLSETSLWIRGGQQYVAGFVQKTGTNILATSGYFSMIAKTY